MQRFKSLAQRRNSCSSHAAVFNTFTSNAISPRLQTHRTLRAAGDENMARAAVPDVRIPCRKWSTTLAFTGNVTTPLRGLSCSRRLSRSSPAGNPEKCACGSRLSPARTVHDPTPRGRRVGLCRFARMAG